MNYIELLFFRVYIIIAMLFYKHFSKPPHNTVSQVVHLASLSTAMPFANLALTLFTI